jgi:predicted RNA-binding Zn ribbon-like protein
VDFLNTLDVEDETDVLAQTATWRQWAGDRELTPDALHTARATREALRAAVGDRFAAQAPLAMPVQIRLSPDGPSLITTGAVGAVLAAATRLTVLGEWQRVKICPADDCRWAFYDESRNRSRNWCSMRVCGNREKARAWRERTGQQPPE